MPFSATDTGLLAHLPLAFWASRGAADDYRIVLWNDAASRQYGIPQEAAIGERFTSLFVEPEARAQAEADADAVIASGHHPVNTIAVDYRRDDHKPLILLTNVFRLVLDDTALHAEISVDLTESDELGRYISSDIRKRIFTSNKRTVDYLLADRRRAEQRRHLGLVASVAHEVRSELAVITQALESNAPGDRAIGIVASQRSSDYIETLLIHAQAASSDEIMMNPRASTQRFSPSEVIARVRERHSNTSSPLEWTPGEDGMTSSVRGNARDFELALSNILGNAVRHGESGKPIVIASHVFQPRSHVAGSVKVVVSNRPRRATAAVAKALELSVEQELTAQSRFGLAVVRLLAATANAQFTIRVEGQYVIASLDWPVMDAET